ncbi:hypothetical protein BDF22DRAFT_773850 [Syncephalis plumigaleata]|nr:hypothetical protein BDF22DRAFT_773850 [Syncephalis plumigaleata]
MTKRPIRRHSPVKRTGGSTVSADRLPAQRDKITSTTLVVNKRTKDQWVDLPLQVKRSILDSLEGVATTIITEIEDEEVKSRVQRHINALLRKVENAIRSLKVPPTKYTTKNSQQKRILQLMTNQRPAEQNIDSRRDKLMELGSIYEQMERYYEQDKRIQDEAMSKLESIYIDENRVHDTTRASSIERRQSLAEYRPENDEQLAVVMARLAPQLEKLERCQATSNALMNALTSAECTLFERVINRKETTRQTTE